MYLVYVCSLISMLVCSPGYHDLRHKIYRQPLNLGRLAYKRKHLALSSTYSPTLPIIHSHSACHPSSNTNLTPKCTREKSLSPPASSSMESSSMDQTRLRSSESLHELLFTSLESNMLISVSSIPVCPMLSQQRSFMNLIAIFSQRATHNQNL